MRRDKRDVIICLVQDLFLDSFIDKTTMCASILQNLTGILHFLSLLSV